MNIKCRKSTLSNWQKVINQNKSLYNNSQSGSQPAVTPKPYMAPVAQETAPAETSTRPPLASPFQLPRLHTHTHTSES